MASDSGTPNPNKLRWADQSDDEENADLSSLLPPRQVIGPDEKGIKKVIEYRFDEAGNKVRTTTTSRVRKVTTKMSKGAVERMSWAKFGDAVNDEVGSCLTMVSTEEIFLERPRVQGEVEKKPEARGDGLGQLEKKSGFIKVCRTCGKKNDHFTAMCPYKDLLQHGEASNSESPPSADGASSKNSSSYVPPNLREGAKSTGGSDTRRRSEENSIRVSNLSVDAQEADLHELFSPFGPITRIYVAPDHNSVGLNRGFAYISFLNKEDAERAINKLNGYGYDNLILKVEVSLPRSK